MDMEDWKLVLNEYRYRKSILKIITRSGLNLYGSIADVRDGFFKLVNDRTLLESVIAFDDVKTFCELNHLEVGESNAK